jgi:hypothetical protein
MNDPFIHERAARSLSASCAKNPTILAASTALSRCSSPAARARGNRIGCHHTRATRREGRARRASLAKPQPRLLAANEFLYLD